jgi:hypothetical protein
VIAVGWSPWQRCPIPARALKYRHLEALQRRVRADIAEAERRGDLAQLAIFMAQKLKVDRQMRDADA